MDQESVQGAMELEAFEVAIDGTTDGSGRMVQPETHPSALTVKHIDFFILFN